MQYSLYNEGDYYDWHSDQHGTKYADGMIRKLSFAINLIFIFNPYMTINIPTKKIKKPVPTQTASVWSNIKNSSIYKLLENEKLLGTELGHGALIELIHLAQNSGLLKKGGRVK